MNVFFYFIAGLAYIGVGLVWGFLRWTRFVDNELSFYASEKQRFLIHHRIRGNEFPDHLRYEWKHVVSTSERLSAIPPDIKNHNGEIGFDVVTWPLSMLALVVQIVFAFALRHIVAQYDKVTARKIDRVRRDLKR